MVTKIESISYVKNLFLSSPLCIIGSLLFVEFKKLKGGTAICLEAMISGPFLLLLLHRSVIEGVLTEDKTMNTLLPW